MPNLNYRTGGTVVGLGGGTAGVEGDFAYRGDGASLAALPKLRTALAQYNDSTSGAVGVIGLGSSVGAGDTVTSPGTNAPSAYFTTKLSQALNKLGNVDFVHHNGSIGGHAIIQGAADYTAAKTAAGFTPKVVTNSWGMNDGNSALYHNGQTLGLVKTAMLEIIAAARVDGADPVFFTSPHPHTGRQTWAMGGPAVVYPASGVMIPDDTVGQSIVTLTLPNGDTVPASYRHHRVNNIIREVGAEMGVTVIDAERFWFEGVVEHGEDALFNSGEVVHPNTLGHQVSYHAAIDHWAAGLADGRTVTTQPPDLARTWDQKFNVQTSSPLTIPLADYDYGILTVMARHPGFGAARHGAAYLVVGEASTARVVQLGELDAGGSDLFTVAGSGTNITITPAINGTDLRWTLVKGLPLNT